jgi:hypothetical protein
MTIACGRRSLGIAKNAINTGFAASAFNPILLQKSQFGRCQFSRPEARELEISGRCALARSLEVACGFNVQIGVPHITFEKPRLWLLKFVFNGAKRLLQQNQFNCGRQLSAPKLTLRARSRTDVFVLCDPYVTPQSNGRNSVQSTELASTNLVMPAKAIVRPSIKLA